VRVNLADLSDANDRKHFETATDALVSKSANTIRRAMPAIWARLK
jgi:hypothetical protein